MFVNDCYVDFPALAEDMMEGVSSVMAVVRKKEQAPNPADII
jgi:hypothetical protein